jgi:hypothetical protein
MEKNVSKLIKKMLSEQGISKTGGLDNSQGITDPNLKMAYQLNCYDTILKRGGIVDKWENREVIKLTNSTKKPGYPIAVLYSPDNKGIGSLKYFSADGKNEYTAEGPLTYFCQKMTSIVEDSLKPEFKEFIDKTRENNPTIQIYSYGDTSDTVSKGKFNGSCKLQKIEDLLNERPDLKPYLGSNTQIFVWNCGQVKGGTFSAQESELIKLGYTKCTDEQLVPGAFLGTIKKVGEVSYCKPKVGGGNIGENATYLALEGAIESLGGGPTKDGCRTLIENYYTAAKSKLPIPQNKLEEYKDAIVACRDNETIKLDRFLSKKITKTLEELQYMPTYKFRDGSTVSYKLSTGQSQIRESVLKRIIRENLNELSESKKKSLVEEYNIINLRFNIITESRRPKTKKQKEKFVDDIINEIFYLKSQGFNETLINEQFLDIVKSFFGQVPGGIFDTLKERFAQFILEKLGVGTDGYLANIFIATIGDIPIGDYVNGKIFDCQYLSNAISKGVGEGIARKIQKEQGMEGPFYDIVRNAMVDMFTDSSFGDKIENALGQMICPSLPKIKARFDSAGETMKEKALS